METLTRHDGIPLEAKEIIPLIKTRKEMAESLAAKFGGGSLAWFRGYNDMTQNNYFISDFCFMLEYIEAQDVENKKLLGRISDLENQVESLGGKVG